jgi:mannose-6-phosphate isomerase-like protein (cupin superfamily)
MIRTGQTIENPVTGERLIFHETARDTNGEYVKVEAILRPGALVAAAHVHPYQTERFEVLAGTVAMKVGRKRIEALPAEVVTVDPGTPHKFWNAGDDEARFVCEVRPAGAFEQLIETMFGLAADGKTSRKGMPSPLRLAVIARHHFDDVRLPGIPHALQRAALALGAPLGRAVGYDATYAPVVALAAVEVEAAAAYEALAA